MLRPSALIRRVSAAVVCSVASGAFYGGAVIGPRPRHHGADELLSRRGAHRRLAGGQRLLKAGEVGAAGSAQFVPARDRGLQNTRGDLGHDQP